MPSALTIARDLDGAALHVAILDGAGRILSLSPAWQQLAVAAGLSAGAMKPGSDGSGLFGGSSTAAIRLQAALHGLQTGREDAITLQTSVGLVIATRLVQAEPASVMLLLWPAVPPSESVEPGTGEAYLQPILDAVPAMIAYIDRNQRYRLVNRRYGQCFNRPAAEIVGLSVEELVGRELYAALAPCIRTAFNGQPAELEREVPCRDGNRRYMRIAYRPHRGPDGGVLGLVAMTQDLTERKQMESALAAEKELAQLTLQSITDAVITTDAEGRIDNVNVAAEILTGWNRDEAKGQPVGQVFRIMHPTTMQPVEGPVEACIQGGVPSWVNDAVLIDREGVEFLVATRVAPIRRPSGEIVGAVLVFQDVTKERRLARRVAHQATHDALTGLPNRLLFRDRLQQALQFARRHRTCVALMLLDLDHFKDVNDSLGHLFGDRLLCAVAKRLRTTVRESDTLARLGGDEFAIVQTGLRDHAGAAVLADKIIEAMMQPFVIDGHEIDTSTSIGIAFFGQDDLAADQLLKNADMAMYRAKADGRNRFQFFLREMDTEIKHRRLVERDLREALEGEQFSLHYRPQVELASRRIVAYESQLCWRHPKDGLLAPDAFMTVAETTGLSRPIGLWALNQVVAQARSWLAAGHQAEIGLSLSPAQLKQAALPLQIERVLANAKLSACHLTLGIPENLVAALAAPDLRRSLHTLAARGIQLTVENFGTGHASLVELRQLPIRKLRLDRSLVEAIGQDEDLEAVLRAAIALGRSLGKRVQADGVATEQQLKGLIEAGCDEALGPLFGEPRPGGQIDQPITTVLAPAGRRSRV